MSPPEHTSKDTADSINVDHLKRQLMGYKRYFRGEITKLSTLVEADGAKDLNTIDSRIQRLVNNFSKYNFMVKSLAEEGELESDGDLKDYYYRTLSTAASLLPASGFATPVSQSAHLKLPPIALPTFSGKYGEWSAFYDTFSSLIHNDKQINKIEKLHYLKSVLNGDAAQVTASRDVSAANYDIAWDCLKNRYDNKRLIMQNHMKGFLSIPSIAKQSFGPLRTLLDQATQHLKSLDALNRPIETKFDDLVVYLISDKLDHTTRHEWESSINSGECPDWEKLKTFLRDKCNVLEMERLYLTKIEKPEKIGKPWQRHSTSLAASTGKRLKCNHCYQDHLIINCVKFKNIPLQSRIDEAPSKGLCLNCLQPGHGVKTCTSRGCLKCHKKHHTPLHLDDIHFSNLPQSQLMLAQSKDKPSQVDSIVNEKMAVSHAASNCVHPNASNSVLLSTCVINVRDTFGNYHPTKALLDTGSQVNLISTSLAKRLQIPQFPINMPVTGVGQNTTNIQRFVTTDIQYRVTNYRAELKFLVIPAITGKTAAQYIPINILNVPKNLPLADPTFNIPSEIDVLIAAELFYYLMYVGRVATNDILYQKTLLGWIATGYCNKFRKTKEPVEEANVALCNQVSTNNEEATLNATLKKFWEIEKSYIYNAIQTPEEQQCKRLFTETTKKLSNGRFCVSLPWKMSPANLPPSRQQALRRFYSLERKLLQNSALRDEYNHFMKEYYDLAHMKIAADQCCEDGYFLPHHAVFKESRLTTKVRVIFDASAKTDTAYSLNDCLMVGATLQDAILVAHSFPKA